MDRNRRLVKNLKRGEDYLVISYVVLERDLRLEDNVALRQAFQEVRLLVACCFCKSKQVF